MAKGMSLEEFKAALSSDATVENEKLKTELQELKKKLEAEITELKEKSEQYEQWCKQLGRRCFVQTRGVMCMNSGVECCDYALTSDDWEAIISYMQKNKMPRTLETYKQVIKFMHDRRKNLY